MHEIAKLTQEVNNLRSEAQECFWAFFKKLHEIYQDLEKDRMKPGSVSKERLSDQIDDYYIYTAGYRKKKEMVVAKYDKLIARIEELKKEELNVTQRVFLKHAEKGLAEVVDIRTRIKKMADDLNKKQ